MKTLLTVIAVVIALASLLHGTDSAPVKAVEKRKVSLTTVLMSRPWNFHCLHIRASFACMMLLVYVDGKRSQTTWSNFVFVRVGNTAEIWNKLYKCIAHNCTSFGFRNGAQYVTRVLLNLKKTRSVRRTGSTRVYVQETFLAFQQKRLTKVFYFSIVYTLLVVLFYLAYGVWFDRIAFQECHWGRLTFSCDTYMPFTAQFWYSNVHYRSIIWLGMKLSPASVVLYFILWFLTLIWLLISWIFVHFSCFRRWKL